MNTRLALRDLEAAKANLSPGTLVQAHGEYELWKGRDVITTARCGEKRLKTNCWVVRHPATDWETYWHGDKTQARNEQSARYHFERKSGLVPLEPPPAP